MILLHFCQRVICKLKYTQDITAFGGGEGGGAATLNSCTNQMQSRKTFLAAEMNAGPAEMIPSAVLVKANAQASERRPLGDLLKVSSPPEEEEESPRLDGGRRSYCSWNIEDHPVGRLNRSGVSESPWQQWVCIDVFSFSSERHRTGLGRKTRRRWNTGRESRWRFQTEWPEISEKIK